MKRTSWGAVALVIFLGTAIGVGGGTFLAWWLPIARATHTGLGSFLRGPFDGKPYVHLLMIGEDDTAKRNGNGNGLSDTLVVISIDTNTKEIRGLSIPRDTKVEIPGHGTCKINSAHVYGGPELTREAIQDLLGISIDYHIKTNTTGLRGLVDLVDGVYIVVDKDMHYTDRHGGLYIDLHASPEKQLLDGKQAEGFVRFRKDRVGDSGFIYKDGKKIPCGRVVRQQIFMRALANRILSLPSKRERAKVLEEAYKRKYIVSDLNLQDWDGLSEFFKDIKPEEVEMTVLPGEPRNVHGASYWDPNFEEIAEAVDTYILFKAPVGDEMAKVEVLNGSGVVGAAKKVADKIKQAGFDVTRTDNAKRFDYSNCCIITRKGKSAPVERLARLLNCSDIREETATGNEVDITVIVGRDIAVQ